MDKSQSDLEKLEQRIQQYDLVEFYEWVKKHRASIEKVGSYGITATDGTVDYRFEPKGGLSISYWPQLKNICELNDPDNADVYRDEIMEAILENQLQQFSVLVSGNVVSELVRHFRGKGYLFWDSIESIPFGDVVDYMIARAKERTKEMHKGLQKKKEQDLLARQKAEENESLLNDIMDTLKLRTPSQIPSDNLKIIKTVKIGFGHESFWLDFGENDKVTLKKEENWIFRCFVRKVLAGSQIETVFHSDLNEAISESTPTPPAASEKLRRKIGSLNRKFKKKGRPLDNDYWIVVDKTTGYYLNKTVKWDVDPDTIINRKSNSKWLEFYGSRTIDNWYEGKEGGDE